MSTLSHDSFPASIPKLHLRDLALACERLVAKGGDDRLTFKEFQAALWAARIPLSGKASGAAASHYIELADDDDLELTVVDDQVCLDYFGDRCRRNPIASLKAVVESRLALLQRLGVIEHAVDPVEEARIDALVEDAMAEDEALRRQL